MQELASKKTLHDAPLGDLTDSKRRIRDIHVDELRRVVNDMVVHIDMLKATTLTKQAVEYTDEKVDRSWAHRGEQRHLQGFVQLPWRRQQQVMLKCAP